jgi:hypothetical protein
MNGSGSLPRSLQSLLRSYRYELWGLGILLGALSLSGALDAQTGDPSAAVPASPAPSIQPAPILPVMDYRYAVSWGGMSVGQMQVSLKPGGKPGCYRYEAISHPSALAAMLYGAPNETSLFCVKDGTIVSQHFESVLPSDDKQSYTLDFDWDQHKVTNSKGPTRDLPADAVDSFNLQQAVRLWVVAHAQDKTSPIAEFTMVDRKNLTHYQFRLAGHEPVQTPAGQFDTLKLERIDNPDKIGRFWLAPGKDYMPVVIETKNGGKPTVRMELVS